MERDECGHTDIVKQLGLVVNVYATMRSMLDAVMVRLRPVPAREGKADDTELVRKPKRTR